ncbi:LysR substrate-binding domain-containing protein [Olsenella profusa]|uniref:LysR family transcriptional regulator n=1 Tax=Olsenella profusa TaxID=138595 RepID=A0ABS2F4L4_9ACTN|nr:LysR family transcriptional regulator [Olsenella profusa]
MNLKQLEYFVAIAEEGQITAAARRLHISQPPLSYELAQLEQELDTQLVRRGPRGVTLTEAGRLLLGRARRILAMATATAREVSSVGKGLTGTLCLAVVDAAAGLVPSVRLAELTRRAPEVSLELREGSVPEVIELVASGIAEVGVVRTPFPTQGLRCRYAPSEPLVAVMPPELETGDELSVMLCELVGRPLVCERRRFEVVSGEARSHGMELTPFALTADERTTCSCAAAGLGVGLVPHSLLTVCDTGGCYIKTVTEKALESRAAVIWQADRALSPLAERAVTLLGELS